MLENGIIKKLLRRTTLVQEGLSMANWPLFSDRQMKLFG